MGGKEERTEDFSTLTGQGWDGPNTEVVKVLQWPGSPTLSFYPPFVTPRLCDILAPSPE